MRLMVLGADKHEWKKWLMVEKKKENSYRRRRKKKAYIPEAGAQLLSHEYLPVGNTAGAYS